MSEWHGMCLWKDFTLGLMSCLALKLEFLCYCSAFDNFQMQTMFNKQIEDLSTLLRKLQD
ncbi:hypothetical protein M6B38_409210 [Iris pallida]|uniref:Uncharacterized protein n=1 Tax=Iris pallida TaxID=29817 RepID=A0AAX6FN14_IRIPA|nr:hypothetical protein M6B38_409210 [Iris pallida]